MLQIISQHATLIYSKIFLHKTKVNFCSKVKPVLAVGVHLG